MTQTIAQQLHGLINFCEASFLWCAKESESATSKVNDVLTMLLDDAHRVASMSKETLRAIKSLREVVQMLGPAGDREVAKELALSLVEMANEDEEIANFVSPVMASLQFQDRISQNMGNIIKMLKTWVESREQISGRDATADELSAFGTQLLGCTTMVDERNVIRKHISGLADENSTEKNTLFF